MILAGPSPDGFSFGLDCSIVRAGQEEVEMRGLVLRVATGMGMGVGICVAYAVGAVDLPPPLADADFRPVRLE